MSRMNAAWSNEPQWVEALPAILKEPMTIAFGGAIVAHAIFFLGLPVVAGSEKQPDVQPVATTVLTDQEKAQIPSDLAQSQFSTGSLLPGSTSGLTMPPTSFGTMPPAGSGSTSSGSGFTFDQPTYTPPAITNNDNSAQVAEIARQDRERREKAEKNLNEEKEVQKLLQAQQQTSPSQGMQSGLSPTTKDLGIKTDAPPPGNTQSESPSPTPSPDQPTPTPTAITLNDQQLIAERPEFFAFNLKQPVPTQATKTDAFRMWLDKEDSKQKEVFRSSKQSPKSFPLKTKNIPYPTQFKDKRQPRVPDYAQKVSQGFGTAVVGVVTDGKGYALEASIIQSTGYQFLDEYVIDYVVTQKKVMFPASGGKNELYTIEIPVALPTPAQQATS